MTSIKSMRCIALALLPISLLYGFQGCRAPDQRRAVQLTHDLSYNHDLDNNDNFSPDDQWLVYDVRTESGGIGGCGRIEKVHIQTGEKVILYALDDNQWYGPGVGAVSYAHTENAVAFIHGLMNCTEETPYEQWRRTGVVVRDAAPGVPVMIDARDVTWPYTPGALRGGTHRHEWSRDGGWIGFTYNDAVMKALADSTGKMWNLRTIGVTKLGHSVEVDLDPAGENNHGVGYSVLVVHVVPDPKPGSDEISRAAGDSWIGVKGYRKEDDTWQRARAFIGTVISKDGNPVDELFVVDIPGQIDIPGPLGPLEGTRTGFPMPPAGAKQRRLTHTAENEYPGCEGVARSSSDGRWIAYLAFDGQGTKQVFLIHPEGGIPEQLTRHDSDVQSGVRWHPDGSQLCYIWDNSLVLHRLAHTGESAGFERLTAPAEQPPTNPVWSHSGEIIAYNRIVPEGNQKAGSKQIYLIHL
jgi:hypothetical protein